MIQSYPHRIRLRGPWQCEPAARRPSDTGNEPVPGARRITMPCRWQEAGLGDFKGVVRFRRRFGYPGRIDDYERVWLTFAGIEGEATIILNQQSLAIADRQTTAEYDVTQMLESRNELVVELEANSPDAGLWGDVALEVRRTAFLRNVFARFEGGEGGKRIRCAGQIVGCHKNPLDLYLLLNQRNIGYLSVPPSSEQSSFDFLSDGLEGNFLLRENQSTCVRVELIEGGVVWYGLEAPINSNSA